ncbi:tripartite tricarboxylate transporter TctB family protein [Ornithinibacillus halophilus]|uniref:Tripartite tricarboxylate transporter TctB family protein n=1 Tax=Ornithinibacillus halophilus TaxID=930117 RepID=A0A1M5HIR8_9BACI|nr:tripartite tricarboxylate transporter TctB family protein [Ornithinibacillus halophilus]SHG15859.1 Tripartite tricarboxylate transporter TctB family protein [Ornithinibacillus halophilus]
MKSNLVLGFITILFSVFFLIKSLQIPEARSSTVVGPAEWPIIILTFMLIMGIAQVIKTILDHKKGAFDVAESSNEEDEELPSVQGKIKEGTGGSHWYILIAIALYTILLPIVGFLVVTPFLFLFMAWLLGMKKRIHLLLTTVGSYVLFIALFIYVLGIPFPRGIGIFRDLSFWIY